MAIALEALQRGPKDRSHLTVVSGLRRMDVNSQEQLLPELPFGTVTPVLDPEAFSRMHQTDPSDPVDSEMATQLNLRNLPANLVEPDEFHKEYETETGNTYYATSVRYNPLDGSMIPTGRNTIVASGEIYGSDEETIEQTTVQIGYEGWEANYVAVNRQNLRLLGDFYEGRAAGRGASSPPISEIIQFSGPFTDAKTAPVEDGIKGTNTEEYAYRDEDRLVIERVDHTTGLIKRVDVPFVLDADLYYHLKHEGKSGQAEDSDEAFVHPLTNTHHSDEYTVYEVPQKYPVKFTSLLSTK